MNHRMLVLLISLSFQFGIPAHAEDSCRKITSLLSSDLDLVSKYLGRSNSDELNNKDSEKCSLLRFYTNSAKSNFRFAQQVNCEQEARLTMESLRPENLTGKYCGL